MTYVRPGPTECAHCGQAIEQPERGRTKKYCSGVCRQAGHRYGDPCPRSHRIEGHPHKSCVHPPPPRRWGY